MFRLQRSVVGLNRLAAASGRSGVGGSSSGVPVDGDGVDDEGVAEQVEVLAGGAEAVGSSQVEGVVEVAVDALGVVAAGVEPREVRVPRAERFSSRLA